MEYYSIFFNELPELNVSDEKLRLVTKDLVYNYEKYIFFDDVADSILSLKRKYKLAVVSDAWPSLVNVFKVAGLRQYFTSFVVSAIIGVSKPDEKMYKTALEELNLLPSEVIFIDDSIRNCNGAKKVGIDNTFLLCRDSKLFIYHKLTCKNHIVVRNLRQIENIIN